MIELVNAFRPWMVYLPTPTQEIHASMILSGMGPFGPLQTDSGKLFAGLYALFSGLAFITIVGIVLVPVVHRLFHKFHLESHRAGDGEEGYPLR